ncbi:MULTISPECIES: hypothetical protein [Streptomyces]|uniref:hypothetical protein n=1 Tax=Streptomyces TaxID=1883 RepID=UPI0002F5A376|nr:MULTISPECIES: hypothetical protein [Streptomyces]MBE9500028.1 hypothetical protein [Streptomyces sp. GKU 257-1]
MRRILTTLIAAAGLIVAVPGSANAADEWYTSSTYPGSKGYGYVGSASSTVSGVYQHLSMYRTNNYVALWTGIGDEATDGYCAGQEIAYQIYTNGTWSGYRYRMAPVHDCTTNGADNSGGYFYSRYKTRNVHSRACHVDSSGRKIHCESKWHGPI